MNNEIIAALHCIPCHERDLWIRMGMAIRSELGDPGFDIWDKWSQEDDSYNERDAKAVWTSMKGNGVTIASLFHEAMANGYQPTGEVLEQRGHPDQKAKREQERKAAEEQDKQRHAEAAAEAERLWSEATPETGEHRYLRDKGVMAHGIRTNGVELLIPVRDTSGMLRSLQRIRPDGTKRFLTGGEVTGHYHGIGKPDGRIAICEGYSTASSVFEATEHAVAIAFNCTNLEPVARALRSKFPDATITIAADDDAGTPNNPGLKAATAAAKAVNGLLAIPAFGEDRPPFATDFNDLAKHAGLATVKQQIKAAGSVADESAAAHYAHAEDGSMNDHNPRQTKARLNETYRNLDPWPDPQPLPDALPPVQAFNPLLLPDVFRPWLSDISERMQCPPDFPAVGAMVALASLIGRRVAIRPKRHDDWIEVCNLWGGVIGRPGIMKSPALAEALKPLRRLVAEAQDAHRDAAKDWDLELDAIKAQQDALKSNLRAEYKKDVVMLDSVKATRHQADMILDEIRRLKERMESGAPRERRYMTSDTTTEKLGELLSENPAGLLVFRDELTGWLRSLDRESREADRAFYLEAWNGTGAFTYDRIGRGTIHIEAACVSILGGIQPGPLVDYVAAAGREGRGADGLLQRFQMMVYPDDPGAWKNVDRYPDTNAKNAAFEVFQRLADPGAFATLAPTPPARIDENSTDPQIPTLGFSEAAQEIFDDWRTVLETEKLRAGEPEIIEAHLAKYRKLVPVLALVSHLADGGTGPVSDDAMVRAAAWAEYLETHMRRVYAAAANPDLPAAHALIAHLPELPDPFTPKNVYDRHWQRLDRDSTKKGIELLVEYDWLRVQRIGTGGRPSDIVHVNPRIGA